MILSERVSGCLRPLTFHGGFKILLRDKSEGFCGTDSHTGRTARQPIAQVAFIGGFFQGSVRLDMSLSFRHVDGSERTGVHTGFAAHTFILVYNHAVILLRNGSHRTDGHTGRIFTVLALYRNAEAHSPHHMKSRIKIIGIRIHFKNTLSLMGDYASDHAGAASDTEIRVSLHKVIHTSAPFPVSIPIWARISS